ncbi:MAG: hypothetical protein ABID61_00380 [Candidatus Micrarchaeota archaeon]
MCPEKQMTKKETAEAVKAELTASLGPRGMSLTELMGTKEVRHILDNARNAGDVREMVKGFLAKRGSVKSGKGPAPKPKAQKKS